MNFTGRQSRRDLGSEIFMEGYDPICRPTIVTIIILKIIECWNSYVWPRLVTDDPSYYLVSNGIQEIRENGFGRKIFLP